MSEGHLVMLVEDETTIASIVVEYLQRAGYRTEHLERGDGAVEAIRRLKPDLLLLDLNLPGMDGLQICRETRTFSQIPIIMVTARVEELDRLLGLELGADDYICKPFSPREVVARVKAQLRRHGLAPAAETQPTLLEVDEASQRVSVMGQRLDLTPKEFRLLRLLQSHPGRVFSRAQILDLAYDQDQDVVDRVIDSHIKNLRRKIAQHLPDRDIIQSVYGVGYRFEI